MSVMPHAFRICEVGGLSEQVLLTNKLIVFIIIIYCYYERAGKISHRDFDHVDSCLNLFAILTYHTYR